MEAVAADTQSESPISRVRVLFVIGALYATQYIPLLFAMMALPIVLRQEGQSATTIGLVQLAALPYLLKFLWAPLVDRWAPGRQHYSSWIGSLSIIHAAFIVVLAFFDPAGSVTPLIIVLVFAIFAISTQDVAVDALAIRLLSPEDRPVGAAFQAGGGYIGALIGGGLFLTAYGWFGWTNALLIQAAIFAIPVLSLLLIMEPPRIPDAVRFGWRDAIGFFRLAGNGRWTIILMTFRLPLIITLLPMQISLVDAGMGPEEFGLWMGIFAMTAAAVASVVIGPMMRGLPRRDALIVAGLATLLAAASILALSYGAPLALRWGLIIAWGTLGLSDVVLFAGAMDRARPAMPGFDFSVQLTLTFILHRFAEPLIGMVIDNAGPRPVFMGSIAVAVIAIGIVVLAFGRRKGELPEPAPI